MKPARALFESQGMLDPLPRAQMLDGFNEGWIDSIKQGNPECCFQLFNLPAQGGLRDVERFGRLPKTSSPGDFHEGH
ncbi:MAG TPA: hypothetical protein VNO32_15560 [Candidatus Acidoferrum sp.]|nr:hypothetical protein [Candidatus Acidoferrum sp.]